jgi:putative Mn2+ efflux pump MntP
MGFLEIFLIGVGLSMDAFAVSLVQGLSVKKIKLENFLKPAITFGIFQALMPFVGWLIGGMVSDKIADYADYVAFVLLIIVGGKMVMEARKEEQEEEAGEEIEESNSNIILLGIATSIDALAIGFTFSLIKNFNIVSAISIIGFTTFFISAAGVYIGNKFGKFLGAKAEYLGGIILIAMGIKALF